MSVLYNHRHLYELHPTRTRNFGVQAAALPSIQQLNLDHNHLRTLECPFVGLGDVGAVQVVNDVAQRCAIPLPLRSETSATQVTRSSPAATAATSLEEEGSGLRDLTSLTQLFVSYNQLRALRGLCGVAHTLTTLIATHNHLTSLDGMQSCQHLTYIDLSHNAIESLRGLPQTCAAPLTASTKAVVAAAPWPSLPAAVHADPSSEVSLIEEAAGTSSIAFSCLTSVEEAARHSANTSTPVRFYEDTPATVASVAGAFSVLEGGVAAAAVPSQVSPRHPAAEREGVVLILAHNRLRSRALTALLSAAVQRKSSGGGPLPLRPWSTALTTLDLSHNYIEDVDNIRRLLAHVPWPIAPATGTSSPPTALDSVLPHTEGNNSSVVCVPVLSRLRRLDVSDNPCLINGSLAKSIAAALPSSSAPATLVGTATDHASLTNHPARRDTVKPSDAVRASRAVAVSPVACRLRYTSHALSSAMRSSAAVLHAAALDNLSSTHTAMEAVLRALADDWWDTPLLGRTAAGAATPEQLFTLFAPSEIHHVVAAALDRQRTERAVLLYGGEVTVLAAALQQHGAPLGPVLCVPTANPVDRAGRYLSSASTAAGRSQDSHQARRAASVRRGAAVPPTAAVFLTPPPKWGHETSTSTVFLQTSLLGGGSPLPRAPESPLGHQGGVSSSTLSADRLTLGRSHNIGRQRSSAEREHGSDVASTSTLETSTVGYRLYRAHGQGAPQSSSAPHVVPELVRDDAVNGAAIKDGVYDGEEQGEGASGAATPVRTESSVGTARASTEAPTSRSCPQTRRTDSAVALQLYKSEVEVLRRRHRELQRQTRDQACVLQRHLGMTRALKEQAAAAQKERDEAHAELTMAQNEIRRLQAEVRALNSTRGSLL
ncbi:hypothetical protein ABL78_8087 [Leptomonas seymouri]|uniref:Leucine-rich repeat protein n=1 Tax=Leptomonas seymouri TaxID=5684 RepID=A0A0N1I133_LEPSE|nr:hypothetical protein ABL78_8087 [Leptomonas seymouri]|eukprot:KPI82901.1 hypothetical protein ABL78_8087 [Leptomonas seymouri]